MKVLSAIILIAVLGMALFGFLAMGNEMMTNTCLATIVHGSACASENNFGMADYHVSALKYFSTLVFPALIALLSVLTFFVVSNIFQVLPEVSFVRNFSFELKKYEQPRDRILSWLSLFELSPNR